MANRMGRAQGARRDLRRRKGGTQSGPLFFGGNLCASGTCAVAITSSAPGARALTKAVASSCPEAR